MEKLSWVVIIFLLAMTIYGFIQERKRRKLLEKQLLAEAKNFIEYKPKKPFGKYGFVVSHIIDAESKRYIQIDFSILDKESYFTKGFELDGAMELRDRLNDAIFYMQEGNPK